MIQRAIEPDLRPVFHMKDELRNEGCQIFWGQRVINSMLKRNQMIKCILHSEKASWLHLQNM